MDIRLHDLIIVGSGPGGYTAALYAARAQLSPLVIAGSVTSGGALMETTEVENFPGFPEGITGPALMLKLQEQAEKFGAILHYEDVIEVDLTGEIKIVRTDEEEYQARAVILATGAAYRKLGLPAEKVLSGHGVSYCATCDGFFFRNQEIAVVGGGDAALEEALFLTKFASKVTVIHRRNELRASKIMSNKAFSNSKIEFLWDSKVKDLRGEESLSGIIIENVKTGNTHELPATGLFVAIGSDPRTIIFREQIALDENNFIKVSHPGTKTSLPGVFACGDVVDHTYRQAITAAASGCKAALDTEEYLSNQNLTTRLEQ